MCKSMLQAFLPEILRHLIQIMLATPIRLSRIHVAVAYQKMHMDMVGIGMHCEQHLKALTVYKMFREILRYLKGSFI